ncbi:uncharacterized protein SOCE836_010920 [Sorangium cellulosum]|uniref:Uncharacterized protein n=1 Tax=Sorangium cellulosum TaxID=56 RepID=A0A4P2QGF4_SORCE|nr:uncharacterized protein SOCE836_010920 [Sorangium cellulosum]
MRRKSSACGALFVEPLHALDEDAGQHAEQRPVLGEPAPPRKRKRQHPRTVRHLGQDVLDQVRRRGTDASAQTRRAETASFTAEGHQPTLFAALAPEPREPAAEQPAVEVGRGRGRRRPAWTRRPGWFRVTRRRTRRDRGSGTRRSCSQGSATSRPPRRAGAGSAPSRSTSRSSGMTSPPSTTPSRSSSSSARTPATTPTAPGRPGPRQASRCTLPRRSAIRYRAY